MKKGLKMKKKRKTIIRTCANVEIVAEDKGIMVPSLSACESLETMAKGIQTLATEF